MNVPRSDHSSAALLAKHFVFGGHGDARSSSEHMWPTVSNQWYMGPFNLSHPQDRGCSAMISPTEVILVSGLGPTGKTTRYNVETKEVLEYSHSVPTKVGDEIKFRDRILLQKLSIIFIFYSFYIIKVSI